MYDINDVYRAFDIAGQNTVNISYSDRFKITNDEVRNACEEVSFEQLLPILKSVVDDIPMENLRATRDAYLSKTDWVVTKAIESGQPVPIEWQSYRQALRDITEHYSSLEEVVWPEKPE